MPGLDLYLVVYDVFNNSRRTKLHDKLLDYGSPVQYSVFECLLDKRTKKKMVTEIYKTIKPRKDSIRIYYICESCAKKAEMNGGKEVLKPPEEAIVAG